MLKIFSFVRKETTSLRSRSIEQVWLCLRLKSNRRKWRFSDSRLGCSATSDVIATLSFQSRESKDLEGFRVVIEWSAEIGTFIKLMIAYFKKILTFQSIKSNYSGLPWTTTSPQRQPLYNFNRRCRRDHCIRTKKRDQKVSISYRHFWKNNLLKRFGDVLD